MFPSDRTLVWLLILLVSGCAQQAKQVAREATPGGVQGGIAELSKPENQQHLAEIAAGPAFENAGRGVARGVIAGTLSELGLADAGSTTQPAAGPATQPATQAAQSAAASFRDASGAMSQSFRTITDGLVTQISQQLRLIVRETLAESLRDGLTGGLRQGLAGAAHDVLADEAFRRDLAAASASIAASAADATSEHLASGIQSKLGPAIAEAVRKDLGPSIRDVIRDELAPGLREALQTQLAQARDASSIDSGIVEQFAGQTSRVVSREAALGLHDAMKQSGMLDATGKLAGQTGGAVRSGINLIWVIAIGAGLLAVALALWLWIVIAKSRRARDEAAKREAGARRLAEAIQLAETQPWGRELREHLRQHFKDKDLDGMLEPEHARG